MDYSFRNYWGLSTMAPREFQLALRNGRRQAFFHQIIRRPYHLVPFETIKRNLNLISRMERGLQEIRLNQITGSVGKHEFFTHSLLPLFNSLENRWIKIYDLTVGPRGYPPIEVYKVEESYFILDGHHRASVARYLGNQTIEAYVTEWLYCPPDQVQASSHGQSLNPPRR